MRDFGRKKKTDKKILYLVGDSVEEIHSELYDPGCRVMRESDGTVAIDRAIQEADAVYLYDLPPYFRDRMALNCYARDKEFYCSLRTASVMFVGGRVERDYDRPVIYHRRSRFFGWQGVVKRLFDIVASLLALAVLWPVMLLVAAAVKLEDGGPVFYRQVRCTKDQREFSIMKFRSMVEGAEIDSGAVLAGVTDDRRTAVGKVLRSTKLDELPQLFNVLKGDMSLVGPRPERPELITSALEKVPEFLLRTKVPAGLTGYAQVCGYYNTSFEDKLKWDLMYIENFSLWLDLKIILMTIPSIIRQETSEDTVWKKV